MKTTAQAPEWYSTTDAYKYAVRTATRTMSRECATKGRKLDNVQLVAWDDHTYTFTGDAVPHWRFYFNAWKRDRVARQRQANRLTSLRQGRTQRWFYLDGAEADNTRFGRATPLAVSGAKSA